MQSYIVLLPIASRPTPLPSPFPFLSLPFPSYATKRARRLQSCSFQKIADLVKLVYTMQYICDCQDGLLGQLQVYQRPSYDARSCSSSNLRP